MLIDPRLAIIEKLTSVSNKLVNKTVKKYENSAYSYCFNFSELKAVSEDLMLDISEKVLSRKIDEQGMYNYLTESFNNKCKDIYHAHAKTKKRGSIEIDLKDISQLKDKEMFVGTSPEILLLQKQEKEEILKSLKKIDTIKIPYSLIIEMFLDGKNSLEIQKSLNLKSSTLDRYKSKAISYLKEIGLSNYYLLEDDIDARLFLINTTTDIIIKSHIFREIKFSNKPFEAKFNYYCSIESYSQNKLIKKDKILLRQEESSNKDTFFCLEKTDLKEVEMEFKELIEIKTNELKAA